MQSFAFRQFFSHEQSIIEDMISLNIGTSVNCTSIALTSVFDIIYLFETKIICSRTNLKGDSFSH